MFDNKEKDGNFISIHIWTKNHSFLKKIQLLVMEESNMKIFEKHFLKNLFQIEQIFKFETYFITYKEKNLNKKNKNLIYLIVHLMVEMKISFLFKMSNLLIFQIIFKSSWNWYYNS
jgi:hypothetical protein